MNRSYKLFYMLKLYYTPHTHHIANEHACSSKRKTRDLSDSEKNTWFYYDVMISSRYSHVLLELEVIRFIYIHKSEAYNYKNDIDYFKSLKIEQLKEVECNYKTNEINCTTVGKVYESCVAQVKAYALSLRKRSALPLYIFAVTQVVNTFI